MDTDDGGAADETKRNNSPVNSTFRRGLEQGVNSIGSCKKIAKFKSLELLVQSVSKLQLASKSLSRLSLRGQVIKSISSVYKR